MIIEMHCHTRERSACSHVGAVELVRRVFSRGLQGIVLTDHHHLWSEEDLRAIRRECAVEDYFLIFAGQEVTTSDRGDVLVYGAQSEIPRGTPLAEIRRRFPDAALVWAHPYRDGRIPFREKLCDSRLDGIEIFSSNHTLSEINRGLEDWHRYRFTAISGTDTHADSYAGLYPTFFDHPPATVQEMAAEIRAGRCRPFFKEIPRAGTTHTQVRELTLGFGGPAAQTVILKTHDSVESWQGAERTYRIMEELGRRCFREGKYRIPRPIDRDVKNLTLIEQRIEGRTLFDLLMEATAREGRRYLMLAAQWLARLHNARLQITMPEEFLENEHKRLPHYVSALHRINHRHTRRIQEIMDIIMDTEEKRFRPRLETLVQGHGDFHLKNIFIGLDDPQDSESLFVAAIDFDSSYSMPPAFDVGTFLAQFQNQLYPYPEVRRKIPAEIFLEAYLAAATGLDNDFPAQVELFKARTTLSIIYYLVKVGLGESENLWRIMVEAERSLAYLTAEGFIG